jgi:glycosyltransferase involved in cell wall biosynthesis
MKVLYLVHQFFPEHYTGTEKVVCNISSMMQKAGHSVRVVTYSFYKDSFYDKESGNILLREFSYKGIPVTALRHKNMPNNRDLLIEDRELSRVAVEILSAERPDVVHAGHPMRVCEFIAAAGRMNIPYLMTLTDFWLICPRVNLINSRGDLCKGPVQGNNCLHFCSDMPHESVAQRLDRVPSLLAGARGIVTPSRFVRGMFINALGPMDIRVINHGISWRFLKKRAKIYRKDDPVIFCYAGSLNHHKGVHVLLRAFTKVPSSRICLKLYGTGPDSSYVDALHETAKTDKRIEFCGVYAEEDVGRVLSRVDVIVVPSMCYESYSLVMHEALASQIPVVVSNVGVMAEKIKDGVNGFTFPIGDPHALAKILGRIGDNPGILNGLKDNIKGIVPPSIEQETLSYCTIYAGMGGV